MYLSTLPSQLFDDDGLPLNGGQLWTYASGTNTPQTTYLDNQGDATNTNPIVLDQGNFVMWLDPALEYDFLLTRADNSTVRSYENYYGVPPSAEVVTSVNGETGAAVLTADDIGFTTGTSTSWLDAPSDVAAALDSTIEQVDLNKTNIAAIKDVSTSTAVLYTGNSTLSITDKGKTHFKTDNSNVTINGGVFAANDRCYIHNANSLTSMSVLVGSGGMQIYANGQAATGTRTIGVNSRVEVWFYSATVAFLSGTVT